MSEPRTIKKYPNRRLYDTVESRYITLADIRRLVIDRIDFVVMDKKSQEDITRSILLQVIAEQEHGGEPLMSRDFLSQIIRSYGGAMQGMIGSYLEQSLKLFAGQQRDARERIKNVGDPESADAVNHLLVVGFYLINIGFVSLALKTAAVIDTSRAAIELLSDKMGMVLLILGAMHFFNLYVFSRIRRSARLPHGPMTPNPPVAPDAVLAPVPCCFFDQVSHRLALRHGDQDRQVRRYRHLLERTDIGSACISGWNHPDRCECGRAE